MLSLDQLRQQLERHEPQPLPDVPNANHAAVACILRERQELEVLLIRRTEMPGDPWSGHMAFPGGRQEPEDPDLLATAMRETREEVGVELDSEGELIGRLDDLQAMAGGLPVNLIIRPYVFALEEAAPLVLNTEVAEALWAPLGPLADGAADTTRPYRFQGTTLQLPGYRVGPHVVWGLTYRMLRSLFDVVGP